MMSEKHVKVLNLFELGKLKIDFDEKGDPFAIGVRGKRLKTTTRGREYESVSYSDPGKKRANGTTKGSSNIYLHVLVLLWRDRKPFDSSVYEVHHIDGNHINNRPENLELLDKSKHGAKTHKSLIEKEEAILSDIQIEVIKNILKTAVFPKISLISSLYAVRPKVIKTIYESIQENGS
jgi:HNH endonuclease